MKKRTKGKSRQRNGRGFLVLSVGVVTALVLVSGWWLLLSDSESRARDACLDRISVVVDRLDQLSEAWQDRPAELAPGSAQHTKKAKKTKAPQKQELEVEDDNKPLLDKRPANDRAPAPENDIPEQDKEKLRELLRSLEKTEE